MRNYLIIATLAGAAFMGGCSKAKKAEAPEGAEKVSVALPVEDSIVIRQTYPAYLEAENTVDVVARVNGYVTAKHYTDGQTVRKGQVLFTIEDTQYRDAVSQAEAALSTAQSAHDYSSRQYAAMKKALESDAVSQMDVVQAQNAMNEAEANIKSAQAQLQTARTNLGYCTVRALADGRITDASVDVGDYVAGEGAAVKLATIYDDSKVKAMFSVEEARYQDLVTNSRNGSINLDSIAVTFDNPLPHSYFGKLQYMAPDVDVSTGTMAMKLVLDNPYGELRSGMYANVHLPITASTHALLVDDAAISTDQLGKYLYVVNDSDKVVYTPITVGDLYADTLRVVLSGITPESRYVTKALLKVRDGMPVKPVLTK